MSFAGELADANARLARPATGSFPISPVAGSMLARFAICDLGFCVAIPAGTSEWECPAMKSAPAGLAYSTGVFVASTGDCLEADLVGSARDATERAKLLPA